MRKIISNTGFVYVLLAALLLGSCRSSKSLSNKASSMYKKGDYVGALKHYEDILTKKPYYTMSLLRNTSFSYYRLGQYKQAEKYFRILFNTFDSSSSDKEALFAFHKVLQANNKEGEANKIMTLFVTQYPNDSRAVKYHTSLAELNNLKKAPILFYRTGVSKESGKSIYGIPEAIIGDRMIISLKKNAKTSMFFKKNLISGSRTDYNLYTVKVDPLNRFKLQKNINLEQIKKLNSSYDDYGATTSKEGDIIFFASNKPVVGKDKKSLSARNVIYKVKVSNGIAFGQVKKVSFDDGVSNYKTPFLSKDGRMLYFSSDKPGGLGGYDIYKIGISKDGIFDKQAVNLGRNINTESDEVYPYMSAKNKLYFSSNGLLGFGGYDIFENSIDKGGASVNLGKDINSSKNEISFIFDEAKKVGFYSSNSSLYGEDKMYTVKRIDQFTDVKSCKRTISLNIYDSLDRFPLKNVDIYLSNSDGKFIEHSITDSSGFASFSVDCFYGKLKLKFSRTGYVPLEKNEADLNTYDMHSVVFLNKLGIVQGKDMSNRSKEDGSDKDLFVKTKNSYIDFGFSGYNLTENSTKSLDELANILMPYKGKIDIVIISHADSRGSEVFNKKLSVKRANTIFNYLVKKGFAMENLSITPKGELDPIVPCEKCTEQEHAKNRRTLFKVIPLSKKEQTK